MILFFMSRIAVTAIKERIQIRPKKNTKKRYLNKMCENHELTVKNGLNSGF